MCLSIFKASVVAKKAQFRGRGGGAAEGRREERRVKKSGIRRNEGYVVEMVAYSKSEL